MQTNKGFTLMEVVMSIALTGMIAMVAGYLLTFGVKNMLIAPQLANIDSQAQLFLERFTRDVRRIFPDPGRGFSASSSKIILLTSDLEEITYELVGQSILRNSKGEVPHRILDNVSQLHFSLYDEDGVIRVYPDPRVRLFKVQVSITEDNITRTYQTSVYPTSWRLTP